MGSSDHNPSNVLTPGMIGAPNSAFVRIGNDSNAMGSDPGTPGTSSQRVQPATPKEHDQALATLQCFFGGNSQPGSAASNQEKLQKRVIEDHNCLNGQVTRKEFWLDPNAQKSEMLPTSPVQVLNPEGDDFWTRTGRVAKTGAIVGLNVADWGLTGPIGGVPVTGLTVGAGAYISYNNRQAQASEEIGRPLTDYEATGMVGSDLTGATSL
jgi:hypothetical protein